MKALAQVAGKAKAWLATLREDQGGNVVVFFAFSIVPMLTAIGVGIDIANMYMTRSKLQAALDSGALAGAQAYFSRNHENENQRYTTTKDTAFSYMKANVPELSKNGFMPTIDLKLLGDNELEFVAAVSIDTSFTKFLGYDKFDLEVLSTVAAGEARVTEIVLALDNTSSMFWGGGRFVLMREAAKDFASKMFNQAPDPTLLKISVVPWASTVNIKSERPATPSTQSIASTTVDAAGSRLTPAAPFNSRLSYVKHHDSGASFFSTSQVNAIYKPVDWRGCVRAADDEREVNGAGKIKDTFSDAPPATMRWPISYLDYRDDTISGYNKKSNCRRVPRAHTHGGGGGGGGGNTGTQAFLPQFDFVDDPLNAMSFVAGDELAHAATRQVCDTEWVPLPGGRVARCTSREDNGKTNAYWPEDEPCSTNGQSVNGTKRACVSDPNEFAYFAGGGKACAWEKENKIFPWNDHKPIFGPNLNCPTAMLPLSSNRRQVMRKLDHMYPVPGGTHAEVGLMWALRALSPLTAWNNFWGATAEQAPLAFNSETGRKVVILLTDGENRAAEDYEGYWGCSRNSRPGGVGKCWRADSIKKLSDDVHDDLMIDTCTTMKTTYGIELYTIAVDINSADSISLLAQCASSADHAFNITGAELGDTFEELAQTNLRIIK